MIRRLNMKPLGIKINQISQIINLVLVEKVLDEKMFGPVRDQKLDCVKIVATLLVETLLQASIRRLQKVSMAKAGTRHEQRKANHLTSWHPSFSSGSR